MIFTNDIKSNGENTCYYRTAYSPAIFDSLEITEKKALIEFTVNELLDNVEIVYLEGMECEIGVLSDMDVLQINYDMLLKSTNPYSLNLYIFIFTVLIKRFFVRRKSYIPVLAETHFARKAKEEEYKDYTLEIIILHLMLNELKEINETMDMKKVQGVEIDGLLEGLLKPVFTLPVENVEAHGEQVNEGINRESNHSEGFKRGGR